VLTTIAIGGVSRSIPLAELRARQAEYNDPKAR
jgi:hypothetical protein